MVNLPTSLASVGVLTHMAPMAQHFKIRRALIPLVAIFVMNA